MSLLEKQQLFSVLISELILWAKSQGYGVTYGQTYRTPEEAQANANKRIGISNSNHTKRIAADLNLFLHNQYITGSDQYKPLGDHWKSLNPLCCWGGDFASPDGNHFSLEHEGVR